MFIFVMVCDQPREGKLMRVGWTFSMSHWERILITSFVVDFPEWFIAVSLGLPELAYGYFLPDDSVLRNPAITLTSHKLNCVD